MHDNNTFSLYIPNFTIKTLSVSNTQRKCIYAKSIFLKQIKKFGMWDNHGV